MKIKQLNVDCYECAGDLNNVEVLEVLKSSARKCGAKVIGSALRRYPKYGIKAIVFLAESHVMISTYPEIKFAVVEIFLCNEKMDSNVCWEKIKKYLKPKSVKTHEFYHLVE
jgi:S-adenosylmethionine decarboxylase